LPSFFGQLVQDVTSLIHSVLLEQYWDLYFCYYYQQQRKKTSVENADF